MQISICLLKSKNITLIIFKSITMNKNKILINYIRDI